MKHLAIALAPFVIALLIPAMTPPSWMKNKRFWIWVVGLEVLGMSGFVYEMWIWSIQ